MNIVRYFDFAELSEHRTAWESLAEANPMMSPEWMIPWWETYGAPQNHELCCLAGICGRGNLVGFAPFYVTNTKTKKLRLLGDGPACSDHMTLLALPDYDALFSLAVADWMREEAGKSWGAAYFECVRAEDKSILSLSDLLIEKGLSSYKRPNCSSWQVELPDTWDEYLSRLSKNQRKRCRRWWRQWFDSGKITRKSVSKVDKLDAAYEDLCQLHNARRRFLGQTGAFEDPQFFEFHRETTRQLLQGGKLRLDFLVLEGRPITCEYLFNNNNSVFSYQSGYDPEFSSIGAGNISLTSAIKSAIEDGYRTFDFLRGNESYKKSWKASETQTIDVHIHQKNLTGTIEQAKLSTKDWLRYVRSKLTAGSSS